MTAKTNSKPCQTSEMELFSQFVTDIRGELRILSNIEDGAFFKNSQKLKVIQYFCKNLHLGCKVIDKLLLGKTKKKEPNDLQNS